MMKMVSVLLVKPHPPLAILERQCPVHETYRYNWEPLSLKYLARFLNQSFGVRVRVKVWHLMDQHDDGRFLQSVAHELPDIVAFGEMDILVNEVIRLAEQIKSISPGIWTVVGGKQTSLLRKGDRFPYRHIDYAVRGEGAAALAQLIRHRLSGTAPANLPGQVKVDGTRTIKGPDSVNPRIDINAHDTIAVRSVPIEHRELREYINTHQYYPSIGRDEPKTASLLIGSGCPYACNICQSPMEYGESGNRSMLRKPDDVAQEVLWLMEHSNANNFFSLESNLNLENIREVYRSLETYDIDSLALSGFVRAADVVRAHATGLLAHLAGKGLRILSVGLDIPPGAERDIYNKSFSYGEQLECLRICEELGILVLATAIASPAIDRVELAGQLQVLATLPIAQVDIRLAIALRNTPFFHEMENYLLYHPDRDASYYDCQNYRYQTMQVPGKVTPEETYDLVSQFHANYHGNRQHVEYVLRMVKNHPDTIPFFQRLYQDFVEGQKAVPAEIKEAVLTSRPSEASKRRKGMTQKTSQDVILILYTTRYREGGSKFDRAARTMEAEKSTACTDAEIRRAAVESKKEFVACVDSVRRQGRKIRELHFIGHSGMYGPMFGTTSWPEQFSPYEWRTLSLPFAAEGQAWFHCCRSARWFAPFFARTFGVTVWGNHWYTSFSSQRDRFVPEVPSLKGNDRPLYVVGCPGRKSHGLFGSVHKYSALMKAEHMKRFEPGPDVDATYDKVSPQYDEVFSDIRVRVDEWSWLEPRIPQGKTARVLDIGCGNGSLLRTLADRIASGAGVDRSQRMIEKAESRCAGIESLSFRAIDGPFLPFADRSFDIVTSLLSFRYLDWDPIMNEIRRVLAPGGRLLVVDMVTAPVKPKEVPKFLSCKLRNHVQLWRNPRYRQALQHMVTDPAWKTMLAFNPIRAEHELKWYLESRFPGRKVEVLNIGWSSRILAFDSGPLEPGAVAPLTYP